MRRPIRCAISASSGFPETPKREINSAASSVGEITAPYPSTSLSSRPSTALPGDPHLGQSALFDSATHRRYLPVYLHPHPAAPSVSNSTLQPRASEPAHLPTGTSEPPSMPGRTQFDWHLSLPQTPQT